MSAVLRKIVVFFSLIAFTLSSIIGLVGGIQVTTIIYRGMIVFVIFLIGGWIIVPIFVQIWGDDPPEESDYDSFGEENPPDNNEL